MVEHCQQARFVYNIGLEQRSMWRRDKHVRGTRSAPRVNYPSQARELTELRGAVDWVRAGSTVVQQGALRDLDRAFASFFAGRASYPRFKRRSDREGSFVIRDLTMRRQNRKWGSVLIPKIGMVRFKISRPWPQIRSATSARVALRHGWWHVAFTTPPAPKTQPGTAATLVGIDRGVANTVAVSDGQMIQAPAFTPGEQARFLRLQQRLARQHKDSHRRQSTLDQLASLHRRLVDRRRDWVEQVTTRLARQHWLIAVENLQITSMVRRPKPKPDPARPGQFLSNGARAKAALNKAIHASLWGVFVTRLDHKMPAGHLVRVDPRNTSRTCAACGHTAAGTRESQAVFVCQACRHHAHADTNAAVNILTLATRHPHPGAAAGHAVNGRGSPTIGGQRQPSSRACARPGARPSGGEDVKARRPGALRTVA